jgi:hypothetical protein
MDAREAKLPKWAQDELATLRRQREEAFTELREYVNTQEPSDMGILRSPSPGRDTGRQVVFLPKHTIIRCFVDEGPGALQPDSGVRRYFDVRVVGGYDGKPRALEVSTGGSVYPAVRPQAANVIRIDGADRP